MSKPNPSTNRILLRAWFHLWYWPLTSLERLGRMAGRANTNNCFRALGSSTRAKAYY